MCHYWNLLHSFMTNGGLFFFLPFPELSLINESTANHHVKVICLKKRPYFPHPSRTPAGRTFGAIVTVLFTCVFNFLCCSDFIQSSHETHTTSKPKYLLNSASPPTQGKIAQEIIFPEIETTKKQYF